MKNSDMPAMPAKVGCTMQTSQGMAIMPPQNFPGLTKREMMAMHMMQGILAAGDVDEFVVGDEVGYAVFAVGCADALLAELEMHK